MNGDSTGETDLGRRFGGVARLYGESAMRRFAAARVCVVGLGGVGSWAVEALARSGVGELMLIDLDHVAESNVNRQLPALGSTLGKAKVQVLAERVGDINPACRVINVEAFVAEDNLQQLLGDAGDCVLDCIDSSRAKAALLAYCRRQRRFVVTAGGAGGRLDPTRVRVADLSRTEQDPLLARTRKRLRQQFGFPVNPRRRFEIPAVWSDEPLTMPPEACEVRGVGLHCGGLGSVMPVTATFGLVAASLVLRRLARASVAVQVAEG